MFENWIKHTLASGSLGSYCSANGQYIYRLFDNGGGTVGLQINNNFGDVNSWSTCAFTGFGAFNSDNIPVVYCSADGAIVYVATKFLDGNSENMLWKSTNYGVTFNRVVNDVMGSAIKDITCTSDGLTLFILASSLIFSDDGGVTWQGFSTQPFFFYRRMIEISADGSTLAVGSGNAPGQLADCFVEIYNTQTQAVISSSFFEQNAWINSIALSADGLKIALSTYGYNTGSFKSYISSNKGTNWTQSSSNQLHTAIVMSLCGVFVSANGLIIVINVDHYVSTDTTHFIYSTNGGVDFALVVSTDLSAQQFGVKNAIIGSADAAKMYMFPAGAEYFIYSAAPPPQTAQLAQNTVIANMTSTATAVNPEVIVSPPEPVVYDPLAKAVVLNAKTLAITEFDNFPFNSSCVFGGVTLVANANGLFALTEGANDNGLTIQSSLKTAALGQDTQHRKRSSGKLYINADKTSGNIDVTMTVDENSYNYDTANVQKNGLTPYQVRLGKGLHGQYWQMELKSNLCTKLDIESLELELETVRRRIT